MIPLGKQLRIKYSAKLTNIQYVNSSFDKGILQVCYHGKNRNHSDIPKKVIENCIDTIYNCPVVCNYIREDDEIGSHDVEIVHTDKGLKMVNITTPVGVVPSGANYWWEEIDDDGKIHEYLCVEVLLWKRQEAYQKLKENGITDQSMEITVKDGEMVDGYYRVYDFEFTAFCLLGTANPCFESASLHLFEESQFRLQYTEMLEDLKTELTKVQSANAVDISHPQEYSEGGSNTLDKKQELLAKYNLTLDMLDFNIDEYELDELEDKLKSYQSAQNEDGDNKDKNDQGDKGSEQYALTGEQFREELIAALSAEKYTSPCGGEYARYCYIDYSSELSEVYCYDCEDWKLYGFSYSVDGDVISIQFDTKKRKKVSIVDFEGEPDDDAHLFNYMETYSNAETVTKITQEKDDALAKYAEAETTIASLNTELSDLRQFKADKIKDERNASEAAVFELFEDLTGVEAFEALKENASQYSLEELEDKCYALRGRHNTQLAFSSNTPKTPKLPAVQPEANTTSEPYGGLFIKYKNND